MKPVILPPGRARLATMPEPTGSTTLTKTIGTVRVACCSAATWGVVAATMTAGARVTNSAIFLRKFSVPCPANVNPKIAAVGPAQLLQCLEERRDAGLSKCIVGGKVHQHADTPWR
jgi:hypothetical protein